ncbi:GNAT family N-acetyltransferase [Legionella feeleii]|uniref:N-acetyltransferase ats1 n=2 Tax=Legionella feeleii TaxID=453 RepID=A0A0W0U9L0_9GAMM|nr:GNAT family N-acetyltransferase [Legionella feeleii]KTD04670.1 N-acetyltransferase ats1 [Legionella feeleii]SPX59505.1 N-acetyltransferase ats1 [Legionella feeleii]STX38552.1 N-acetyltransferase ats1 [Legionella feeleii]
MREPVKVRFATPQDIDFIYDSLVELVKESRLEKRFSQTKNSLFRMIFLNDSAVEVLIGQAGNNPVGLALFSMTNRNFMLFNGPGIYLHDLFVNERYRRMGIATALINQLKKIARERQCSRIDWVLLTDNKEGKEFYKSLQCAEPVEYIQYMRINHDELGLL